MTQKSVIVAGATGYIGRAVVATALARGYLVYAMVRCEKSAAFPEHPNLSVLQSKFSPITGWNIQLPNADAIISCLASRTGTPKDAHLVDYQMNAGLLKLMRPLIGTRFILLSAICVQKPRLAFQFEKLRFENTLHTSGQPYSIVRPTAYFKSLSGQIARIRKGKSFLCFGDGTQTACTPISERDLAGYLIDCVTLPERHNKILPIGGPHPAITPVDQANLIFDAFGKTPKIKYVSPKIFDIFRAVLAPLAPFSEWARNKRELMKIGQYYATESMLVWNSDQEIYDIAATPQAGSDHLGDHFTNIARGLTVHVADANTQIY